MNVLPEAFAQCKIVCSANCISQTPGLELRIHKKIVSVMLTDVVAGTRCWISATRCWPCLKPLDCRVASLTAMTEACPMAA